MSIDLTADPATRPALLQRIELDQAAIAAGTATPCTARCACHGDIACILAAHPHDAGADMGVDDNGQPRPRGNVHPHAGYDADGQLIQWEHTDAHGPVLTADEVAAQLAETRRAHTRALLASLDLDELRAALAAGGTP